MSIIKKFFGLFSSEAPVKEVDLLEVALQDLNRIKSEKKANDEIEKQEEAKELKMIERKTKLMSIKREMESTFDALEAGRKRVARIEKRIADLEQEELDSLQDYFERSSARRKQLETSLREEEGYKTPQPTTGWVCPHCNHPNPSGVENCEACTAPAPALAPAPVPVPVKEEEEENRPITQRHLLNRGKNPNVK